VRSWLQRSLWDVVPRDQRDTTQALRRRQLVTWSVVLVGAVVLGISLRIEPGSPWFYPATLALAAIWTAGALASGPLHLGRIARRDELRRPVLAPIALGLALAALCLGAGLVLRQVDFVDDQVDSVLDLADQRVLWLVALVTLVNGVAEELFFRGAMYAATPRHPVALTTIAYTTATAVTGNLMLTVAAFALGLVVGLERRASGGILAPALTHVTWSLSLLFLLPVVFG
jgi:hypothetical protein